MLKEGLAESVLQMASRLKTCRFHSVLKWWKPIVSANTNNILVLLLTPLAKLMETHVYKVSK